MESRNKQILLLVFIVLILFSVNYPYLDSLVEGALSTDKFVNVARVIDGDTIEIETGEHVRLLGINTPEKGEEYSKEAKKFLEEKILNKKVRLVFGCDKTDKYKRLLAYVYVGRENVNLEIVENGFANFYFPSGKDMYYEDFYEAWEECIDSGINFCEKSRDICSNCIELVRFDYKEELIILRNGCGFDCDISGWRIKDEGRKGFEFSGFVLEAEGYVEIRVGEGLDKKDILFWRGESYVWTDSGDTLFLRDSDGKLVLWKSY